MLVLSTLHTLLDQLTDGHSVQTALLLTPTGHLLAHASSPARSKDQVRVIVALASEVWQQTKARDARMAESEVPPLPYRYDIPVLPVAPPPGSTALEDVVPAEEDTERKSDVSAPHETTDVGDSPVMLLALHGPSDVDWDELQEKAEALERLLAPSIAPLRGKIALKPITPPKKGRK